MFLNSTKLSAARQILTDCMNPIYKILSARTGNQPLVRTSAPNRKNRIVATSAVALTLCAFGAFGVVPLAPDAANLPVKTIAQEMVLPDLQKQLDALDESEQHFVREEKVRPGDTLAALLSRMGVDDEAAASFIKTDKLARGVMQLKVGKKVQAETDEDGELRWLRTTLGDARDSQIKNLRISRHGDQFKAEEEAANLERRIEMRTGEIRSSLYAATDSAQIPDTVANQIVEMFSTNIDFAADLRRGDHFNIVYETFWQDGEMVKTGRVLAGEFVNGGAKYQAVWFDEPGSAQGGGYYGFDGKSLKKAFLKSPLEFTRISSGFSSRIHPISGQWKAHKGVDFAAPTGTPIRASGDGVIDTVGSQGGYGNMIVIKHWANYSTAYGHMSRFAPGIRKGTQVKQGDVIGFVGSTGWSTGPHLHYEFRVGNDPRDPLSVVVPNAAPLSSSELARFQNVAGDMSHRFALLRPEDKSLKLAMR